VTRNTAGEAHALFAVADGTVAQRVLRTERLLGTNWLETTGITDGDRVIVDGLQKVRNGSKVNAVEVTIDKSGVVRQTLAKSSGSAQ
jgi:membrane fusion protein (multidrug efflux system)